MMFEKLFNCVDKKKISTITVLFPGSFKPMHSGHVNLILAYANHPYVNDVKVFIGPGVRNGITQEAAFKVANLLLEKYENVQVEMVKENSPILACYNFMRSAPDGTYALAGTNKGEDYKRVIKFVNDFKPSGKYNYTLLNEVKVIELNVKVKPITYLYRGDEHNDEPISSTILRKDILNSNTRDFWCNYFPDVDKSTIEKIWKIIQPIII